MSTVAEMIQEIQYRLDEDSSSPDRYTSAVIRSAMSTVQEDIAGIAHSGLLHKLQADQEITVQATGYNLSNLTYAYFRYVNSSLHQLYPIKWIVKIEGEDLGVMDNQYDAGTNYDPKCQVWKNTYYLYVGTYTGDYNKVKLYYIKKPPKFEASTTECLLHIALHPILVDWVEAVLRMNYKYGSFEEALAKRDKAKEAVEILNGKYRSGEIS